MARGSMTIVPGRGERSEREPFGVVLHKSNLPAFVTTMAWEERERGGRYYYQSERDEEGRVVKRYIGTGELAELIAHADETRRRVKEARRDRDKEELERMKALAVPVLEVCEAAEALARAALVAGGYRRHKGEWRRTRG
jgi:hypothetical protein